jgi:hypothetical protein
MKGFTKRRAGIALGAAGIVAILGLAGCGRFDRSQAPAADSPASAETSELSWAGQALQAVGFETADLAPAEAAGSAPSADPTPSSVKDKPTKPGANRRHRLVRYAFGRNALHGEAVVKTDDGTKTVVAQRGTVTAINATTVTVKSTDGFTLTWTFGTPITVIEHRAQVQPNAIAVGTTLGIAGEKTADTTTAHLIVVPNPK